MTQADNVAAARSSTPSDARTNATYEALAASEVISVLAG